MLPGKGIPLFELPIYLMDFNKKRQPIGIVLFENDYKK